MRAEREQVLSVWRSSRVERMDDRALETEMTEVRKAQTVAARAQRDLALAKIKATLAKLQ